MSDLMAHKCAASILDRLGSHDQVMRTTVCLLLSEALVMGYGMPVFRAEVFEALKKPYQTDGVVVIRQDVAPGTVNAALKKTEAEHLTEMELKNGTLLRGAYTKRGVL